MSAKEAQSEPSMEDILASIRRIISEEEADGPKASSGPALELTEAAPPSAADDLMVFDAEEPAPAQPAPMAAAPRAPVPEMSYAPPAEDDGEGIVSQPVASMTAGAMTRLAGTLRITDHPGQTLEGIVREMLKPMLKDWLDANLPAIVESRVEAELERIARLVR